MTLRSGLIFQVAADASLVLRGKGEKRACRCPFHDDRNASAFVSELNVFFCSVCTPGGGMGTKEFATKLGLDWSRYRHELGRPVESKPRQPSFSPVNALATWQRALARARDDDAAERDAAVHEYLSRRGLLEAWEVGAFGVLAGDAGLHPLLAHYPAKGYRILAPLYDLAGRIVNVQARTIEKRIPKTRVPVGSTVAGTVFANHAGVELLRGEDDGSGAVVFGEGLTDMLALACAAIPPVLCAPGTSTAVRAAGPWATGRVVFLALDCDAAGEAALQPTADRLHDAGAACVRKVLWPNRAKDACDVVAARGLDGLATFLSRELAWRPA